MEFSAFDYQCMALALKLAEKGLYTTHPNPRVGCVVADSGQVLGQGWHRAAGEEHAEVAALGQAGAASRGATAYVTLEPCSHEGRTGACADALVAAGISRVVAAVSDPNPEVSGSGLERLRQAGVQVELGLLESAARELNAGFFSRMTRGRPWVRVKCAQSLDGRTALRDGQSKWISSEQSRLDVQHWRARSDAILTGIGTVRADDPNLTVRLSNDSRQPLRVVADSKFSIDAQSRVLLSPGRALIVGSLAGPALDLLTKAGVECLVVGEDEQGEGVGLPGLLRALAEREINEVQVEAGSTLCGNLLKQGLVDEIVLYQAPLLLGVDARPAFAIGPLDSMAQGIHLEILETVRMGRDWRIRLRPMTDE
jgi:diaminohydroxyphosphoribosylaminopyrimidine deaminase/5-amino-6-(5-phosphoribosylamino)uracil reductase